MKHENNVTKFAQRVYTLQWMIAYSMISTTNTCRNDEFRRERLFADSENFPNNQRAKWYLIDTRELSNAHTRTSASLQQTAFFNENDRNLPHLSEYCFSLLPTCSSHCANIHPRKDNRIIYARVSLILAFVDHPFRMTEVVKLAMPYDTKRF